jgi:uncharacterized membrane protein
MNNTTRSFLQSTLFLIWVGLLSIGASGLVAGAMSYAWGDDFVAGDLPWVTYTAERCAELQGASPTTDCREAAAIDHAEEVIGYRIAAGVLGLLVLLGWAAWVRREPRPDDALPPGLVSGAATAMFVAAGLGLGAIGVNLLVISPSDGPGAYLSAAIVSLVVAALFGVRLLKEMTSWARR